MEKRVVKSFNDTFLYSKSDKYEEKLINYIMHGTRIDKDSEAFKDIIASVKRRQVTSVLSKVLMSENVILIHHPIPARKAFKVLCAKDIKEDRKLKVFIDCSALLYESNNIWQTNNIDILISYLVNAMTTYIYFRDHKRVLGNSKVVYSAMDIYAKLVSHIVNFMYKINLLELRKDRCVYMAALFCGCNLFGYEFDDDRVKELARKISNLSEREAEILHITFSKDNVTNLKTFIDGLSETLKLDKLTTDVFVEKWMYLYGPGTQFALEMFPALSSMVTDAYVGAYINNQKSIEKVLGTSMVDYSKQLFRIGEDVIR